MNRAIRNLISLNNLTKVDNVNGQVATLLILFMVLLLIFVLVTVNIGNLGVQSTTLTNAADAAALMLGSNLATKSRMYWEQLGNRFEYCQKKSFWTMILAFVFAVVLTIVSWGSAWVVVWAIVGGVVGGLIGSQIDGISWERGFVTGFIIGAMVGLTAVSMGGAGSVANVEASAVPGFLQDIMIPLIKGGTEAAVLMSIGTAATLYNQGFGGYNKLVNDAMDEIQYQMNKLDETDRFQEQAFYTALKQMVDDPNKVIDQFDFDGDGNINELVPAFFVWWYNRLRLYEQVKNLQLPYVQNFLNQMWTFKYLSYCSQEDDGIMQCDSSHYTYLSLRRLDYRFTFDAEGNDILAPGVADGTIVELLRGLRNYGYNLGNYDVDGGGPLPSGPFWDPGPTPAQMDTWLEEDCCSEAEPGCPECSPPPPGYDWIDYLADHNRLNAAIMHGILSGDSPLTSWSSWIYFFYDRSNPNDPDLMYGQLGNYVAMLTELRDRILALGLPDCDHGCFQDDGFGNIICGVCTGGWEWYQCGEWWEWCYGPPYGDCVRQPPGWPCRTRRGGITIDQASDDEQGPAVNSINTMIDAMNTFRQQIVDFVTNMDNISLANLSGFGGKNPIIYVWEDTRGPMTTIVEAGPWRMPWTKQKNSWTKSCIKLMDHSSDRLWIKTTRIEPAPPVGQLGRWNPFGAFGGGISKVSNVAYGLQGNGTSYVRVRGIRKP